MNIYLKENPYIQRKEMVNHLNIHESSVKTSIGFTSREGDNKTYKSE